MANAPIVTITPDPGLHAHEVGGPRDDCPDCAAKRAVDLSWVTTTVIGGSDWMLPWWLAVPLARLRRGLRF